MRGEEIPRVPRAPLASGLYAKTYRIRCNCIYRIEVVPSIERRFHREVLCRIVMVIASYGFWRD